MKQSNESIISRIGLNLVREAKCSGIQQCVETVGKELGLDGGLVLRTNEIPFLLEMRCCWDPREVIADRNLILDYSESPEHELFNPWGAAGRLNIIENIDAKEIDHISKDFFDMIGAKSFVGCPMVHDGEYLGGMCFYAGNARIWTDDELELIREAAELASNVVARIKLDESTKYLLEEINRRIIDADGARNRFMNNITNEMRTPLNSAMGMVSIMRHNIDNTNVMDECIGRMELLIKQLIELVGECADTSLVSGNDHLVNRTWVQMDPLITGVRKFIDPLVAGKKQNLEFDYDPEASVLADEVKLARILINVLTCSSRFSGEESDIKVTFRIEKVGTRQSMLIISVKDEYGGYGPDSTVNVFDPFSNSHGASSGQINSVGLTMAITRHMTEVMNGSCEFYTDSLGTEFVASIPVEVHQETAGSEEKSVVEKSEQEYNEMYIGRRILIVEDNMMMGEIIATLKGYRGLETDVVINGREALETYKGHEPFYYDMIFMDLQMPQMDGIEATKQIRESGMQDAAIIPVIALSASSLPEEEAKALNNGMNAYLHKPVDEDELFDTINNYLI